MKLTNPKNGEQFISPFKTHEAARAALAARLDAGEYAGNDFASKIHRATETLAGQTPGRVFYLHKFASESKAQAQVAKPLRKVNLSKLVEMLTTAANSDLKHPKIVLTTKGKIEVSLSIAGAKSRYTGAVMVASTTFRGPYYGRVMPNGDFFPGRDYTAEVGDLLNEMSADPKTAAAAQGHMTGRCCFCRRLLSEEKSTKLGYGPVCAHKFGLLHTKEQSAKVNRFASGDLFTGVEGKPAVKTMGKRAANKEARKLRVVRYNKKPMGKIEAQVTMDDFIDKAQTKVVVRRIIRRNIEGV